MLKFFKSLNANILVQEFIKEANGKDLRLFVVDGKVVAAMQREAAPGEFRANIHMGGTASVVKITSEEKKIAIKAAKAMNLKVAGVDIIRSSKGPLLLEVNSSPGLEGIEGATQKDIAGDFSLKTKWVFEEVIEYDSDFELEIVEQDPDIDSIEIFGKLPRLKIKTPLGEYNPDFCYAIKSKEGNKIFLVVEAKGYKSSTAIPIDEKGKIDFAKKYFEALGEYYRDENIKISFKERINKTQLAALIKS